MMNTKISITLLLSFVALHQEIDAFAGVQLNTASCHRDQGPWSFSTRQLSNGPLYSSSAEQSEQIKDTAIEISDSNENEVLTNKVEPVGAASEPTSPPKVKKAAPVKKGAGAQHKTGLLSPLVFATKKVLGEERLNKIRAKAISLHSQTITSFVETSDSKIGEAILARLFVLVDENRDGKLSEEELTKALQKLGFTWLQQKQVSGIMKRADLDNNGEVDAEEFFAEAPKTLKTNLIKLAKKNGADLGLLV